MQAAEHGANFPMAQKIRASMSQSQMHDFAVGSEANKPAHVAKPKKAKAAPAPSNVETGGYDFRTAGHPHKNLGPYLNAPKAGK